MEIGQPHQQVGDHFVLLVALRSVAETGLADLERMAAGSRWELAGISAAKHSS